MNRRWIAVLIGLGVILAGWQVSIRNRAIDSAPQELIPDPKSEPLSFAETKGPQALPIPTTSSTPSSGAVRVESSGGAALRTEQLLVPGLERFAINPEVEEYIRNLHSSLQSKRILLSGLLIGNHLASVSPTEMVPILGRYHRELNESRSEVLGVMKELAKDRANFPPGFQNDLMSITSTLQESNSKEIQSLALSTIQDLRSQHDLSAGEENNILTQSIASYLLAAKDQKSALASLEGELDLTDPSQKKALQEARRRVSEPR